MEFSPARLTRSPSPRTIARWMLICASLFPLGTPAVGETAGEPGVHPVAGPRMNSSRRLRMNNAIAAHKRHARALMDFPHVVASGAGLGLDGEPVIRVYCTSAPVGVLPPSLDGIPIQPVISGRFYALRGESCELSGDGLCEPAERWPLPVPAGVSVGHPAITAGTVGARVTDGSNVFLLSNNHVLANIDRAEFGDPILQPGSFDGGRSPEDAIAILTDAEPIHRCTPLSNGFLCSFTNTMDAAIALASPGALGPGTPEAPPAAETGYGRPSALLHSAYGVADVAGDEDLVDLVGTPVQKFGRTTGLTRGVVEIVNATVDVCYDDLCTIMARFVDQLVVSPPSFSDAGDSGSLIVSDDGTNRPVGLLFAGSSVGSIANRIDLVMNRFGIHFETRQALSAGVTPASVTAEWSMVSLPPGFDQPPVLLTALTSFLERDPATARVRNLDTSAFEVRIEEGQSLDPETAHVGESVAYLAVEPGPVADIGGGTIGEAGFVTVNQASAEQWHTLSFGNTYESPIALMSLTTSHGSHPAHVRIRNVTASSLEYQIEEWDYLDTRHVRERLAYLIVESGVHDIPGAGRLEAFSLPVDHRWVESRYATAFSHAPAVLSQSQTAHGLQAVVTRQDRVGTDSVRLRLQEEEGRGGAHRSESIGYVAIGR